MNILLRKFHFCSTGTRKSQRVPDLLVSNLDLDLILRRIRRIDFSMKKAIALSALLAMGALGMACGGSESNNAAANANKAVANAMNAANAAMANAANQVSNAMTQASNAMNAANSAMANANSAKATNAAPAPNANANKK